MIICGIDPGKKGGIAFLHQSGQVFDLKIMPNTAEEVADLFEPYKATDLFVFMEKAQAMPKNGVSAMFNYGTHFGELRGILVTRRFKHILVSPSTWTKIMHKGIDGDLTAKEKSYRACRRLFPETNLLSTIRCKTPHDGLIDALLIAEYGRRTSN